MKAAALTVEDSSDSDMDDEFESSALMMVKQRIENKKRLTMSTGDKSFLSYDNETNNQGPLKPEKQS